MLNKKTAIMLAAGVLFVSCNMYLALKSNDKVHRSSYLASWEKVKSEQMKSTFASEGVVTPFEEHHVYYSEKPGGFKEFLVKKGDKVDEGTPLYQYASDEGDAERLKAENEKSKLEREVALIEEQIQQLNYLKSVSTQSGGSTAVTGDGTTGMPSSNSSEVVSASIEKEIYDKETDKARIQEEIQKYAEVLEDSTSGDGLGINSEVAGVVKDVNYDLKNPIMTIISDKPKVEGTFAESELQKVEEGMEVIVTSPLFKEKLPGTLTKISSYPESNPSVKKKSRFPYEIELSEENEKLVKGAHVGVAVVTEKVLDAATLSAEAVEKKGKKSYAYVLNETGRIEKRKLKLGLELNGRAEAERGVKKKEYVAKNPDNIKKAGDTFFTPFKAKKVEKKAFKEERKKSIIKYILVGFSKR
ncbi:efflux RND transporter periplasmic adaptor subunit [Bacillus massilinigeriensis]|uniref:efflux RND transporter periplasmic adaptor subunit n=1 Tax=Bacillus mediterraneensis TaxID=1805474 RepID=UPI0008F88E54|nr:HlyD family efflux transporter periplasmic adaptor subunit [Bacillus mediterraneensis]